ncbi:hypothetical protein RFI_21104 [Reticulomyxa filosa]|uniref:Viral A-type inclusion protein n=1 Tax=Reticulomyxa filosa TaxID=46433 RepID=X6MS07_RETFI|nr:hypothetical protein RFI_21104 [Reticulomyxa filosa]|eukprot:ETO16247.1 hypothetical protein RFI_21104 [Reticulomyxa filosa]
MELLLLLLMTKEIHQTTLKQKAQETGLVHSSLQDRNEYQQNDNNQRKHMSPHHSNNSQQDSSTQLNQEKNKLLSLEHTLQNVLQENAKLKEDRKKLGDENNKLKEYLSKVQQRSTSTYQT